MWKELGLNCELHDGLMAEMANLHQKIFLSQTLRPEAMRKFDSSYHESHAARVAEIIEYRKRGGAINDCLLELLDKKLQMPLRRPDNPQFTAALGAALLAP